MWRYDNIFALSTVFYRDPTEFDDFCGNVLIVQPISTIIPTEVHFLRPPEYFRDVSSGWFSDCHVLTNLQAWCSCLSQHKLSYSYQSTLDFIDTSVLSYIANNSTLLLTYSFLIGAFIGSFLKNSLVCFSSGGVSCKKKSSNSDIVKLCLINAELIP